MSLVLVLSVAIRLAATGLSVVLMQRVKDRRMGLLSVMLALMTTRQILMLLAQEEPWAFTARGGATELPGLAVSILAVLFVFCLQRIIVERKQTMEELRDKERIVQSLIANAPYSIWVCNVEGNVIYANQAAIDLFGVTDPGQIIDRYNIYHHSTMGEKSLLPHFERAWAGEIVRYRQRLDTTTLKYDSARKDTLHFYSTLFAIPAAEKSRSNLVVIQEDVTSKVQAEERIRHLHNVLEAIRNINQLIVHVTSRQKLLHGACEILNCTRDYRMVWIGLVQEGTKDVLPEASAGFEEGFLESTRITWDDSDTGRGPTGTAIKTRKPSIMRDVARDPRYEPWKEQALKRGYTSSAAVPLLHSGRIFGALNVYATTPDAFDEEEMSLLVEVGQDIAFALHGLEREEERARAVEAVRKAHDEMEAQVSERTRELSQANASLKEMDRLKSEFLATMSHELRTPLNSIIGFTGIMLQGIAGTVNEEQKKQLSMVNTSAKHLLALINDILDLSRIDAGRMELTIREFVIDDLISKVTQTMSPMVAEKGLRLVTQIPEEPTTLSSDKKKVLQVILNLVDNAVKFTSRGEILIRCRLLDDRIQVTVSDSGVGIKQEDMDSLFESFRQIDGAARRRYQGAGLGLYLCKKLVTLLGGRIWAESEYGKGSTFFVVLPIRFGSAQEHEENDSAG